MYTIRVTHRIIFVPCIPLGEQVIYLNKITNYKIKVYQNTAEETVDRT